MAGYPANWGHYRSYVPLVGPTAFGFEDDIGNVNRFGARFRAANCFRGINLDGYSHSTAQGYSALCRVLFVWSAFESFMRIVGVRQEDTGALLHRYGGTDVLSRIRELDAEGNFYQFIYERVNARHQRELETYRSSDLCNIAYLASAIRHIFSHGHLTPNANSVEPAICIEICHTLSDYLLYTMDREFGSRVAGFLEEIYGG